MHSPSFDAQGATSDQGDGAGGGASPSNAEVDRVIQELISEHGAAAAIEAAAQTMPTLDAGADTLRFLWVRVLEAASQAQLETYRRLDGGASTRP